jgi:hypothetical protein
MSHFIANQKDATFLGASSHEKALVQQWSEFAGSELNSCVRGSILPIFGWETPSETSSSDMKSHLALLNNYLKDGRKHLVGSSWTLADVEVFFNLRHFFQLSYQEQYRNNVCPNVARWFVEVSNNEHFVAVVGRTQLCKAVQKASVAKVVAKKEEPKKEVAKTEDGEEAPKEEKKAKNPLDLIVTTFDMDNFKREFMNSTDRKAVLENFFKTFDSANFSFWTLEYQKLESEGKVLFMTKNSASMFLQKLDHFRKYCFGVYGVYGLEPELDCRGCFFWKGTEIPEEVREHDNFEYTTIKKLDFVKDRATIEAYWLNLNEGDVVDGKPVAHVQTFK